MPEQAWFPSTGRRGPAPQRMFEPARRRPLQASQRAPQWRQAIRRSPMGGLVVLPPQRPRKRGRSKNAARAPPILSLTSAGGTETVELPQFEIFTIAILDVFGGQSDMPKPRQNFTVDPTTTMAAVTLRSATLVGRRRCQLAVQRNGLARVRKLFLLDGASGYPADEPI